MSFGLFVLGGLFVVTKKTWVPGVFAKAHCASMYFASVQYQVVDTGP